MCCLKRTPKYLASRNCVTALLEGFVIVIYLFSVAISLCRRFSVATSNLWNRSVFSISVSNIDSHFSLQVKTVKKKERMMNGGWSSRWVFCDYKLIISKLCYVVVSYIYFSRFKA